MDALLSGEQNAGMIPSKVMDGAGQTLCPFRHPERSRIKCVHTWAYVRELAAPRSPALEQVK